MDTPAEKAEWHLQEVRRLIAEAGASWSAQGMARHLEEALAHVRRGVILAPHSVDLYEVGAEAYGMLCDDSSAVAHLRYALNVAMESEDKREADELRAGGAAPGQRSRPPSKGRPCTAQAARLEARERLRSKLAALLFGRARGWLEAGRCTEAVADLREATELEDAWPQPFLLLAMALVRAGTPAAAAAAAAGAQTSGDGGASSSSLGGAASKVALLDALLACERSLERGLDPTAFYELQERDRAANDAHGIGTGGAGPAGSRHPTGSYPASRIGSRIGSRVGSRRGSRGSGEEASPVLWSAAERATALVLKGKINWALGQMEAGNKDFRAAAVLAPRHPEVKVFENTMAEKARLLYANAKRSIESGDLSRAVVLLTGAVKMTPEDLRLWVTRASALRRLGHFADAMSDLDEASARFFVARHGFDFSPHAPGARFLALPPEPPHPGSSAQGGARDLNCGLSPGNIAAAAGQWGGGAGAALEAGGGAFSKARVQLLRLREAMERAGPVWQREPSEVARQRSLVCNDSALGLMLAGKHLQALRLLDQAVALEQELGTRPLRSPVSPVCKSDAPIVDPRFLVNRGDCLRNLGQLAAALKDLTAAHRMDPENWETRTRLSVVRYEVGIEYFNGQNLAPADAELSEAIRLNPKVAHYHAVRGEVRYQARDLVGAHADLRKALELDPTLVHVASRLQQFEPSMATTRRAIGAKAAPLYPRHKAPKAPMGPGSLGLGPGLAPTGPKQASSAQAALLASQVLGAAKGNPTAATLHVRPDPSALLGYGQASLDEERHGAKPEVLSSVFQWEPPTSPGTGLGRSVNLQFPAIARQSKGTAREAALRRHLVEGLRGAGDGGWVTEKGRVWDSLKAGAKGDFEGCLGAQGVAPPSRAQPPPGRPLKPPFVWKAAADIADLDAAIVARAEEARRRVARAEDPLG